MNQCPTWGVVHAQREYDTNARAMALEAGSTMHQVYAGMRIWQLEYIQKLPNHAREVAHRIFGQERWNKIQAEMDNSLPKREHIQQLAFAILHSSEWYDDPNDQIRTMTNMELSAIYYIDERLEYMENWPIYVEDKKKPKARVGIEQTFDVCLTYDDKRVIRYIGTIDGLVQKAHTEEWFLDENKTASRLDDGWRNSFDMRHQVTGYCAASTAVFGFPIFKSRITGCKVKPTNRGEDVVTVEASRDEHSIRHWAAWVRHTVDMYDQYKDDYEHAPRYTHSCSRYFRPCSLLPFCADTPEGRKEQYEQMKEADLSPSERAVQET
jgi:hypothetical protein